MKNMIPDPRNAFDEYKSAVNRKKGHKQDLIAIEDSVGECYINYENQFENNAVEFISPQHFLTSQKNALLSLYDSKAKIVSDFRRDFFARTIQTYRHICPYCTLNEANTTEHILPKEKYPEYAIHLKNLIPACSVCNEFKGEYVLNSDNQKIIINFYKDIIPDVQYLFVDIYELGDFISLNYRLQNVQSSIDDEFFRLIKSHYEKLQLVGNRNRFNIKAMSLLPELVNDYVLEGFMNEDEYDNYAKKQIRKCKLDAQVLGINHWKVVLQKAVAESEVFKIYIFNKLR